MGSSLGDLSTLTLADDFPELVVRVLFTQGRRAADGDWTDITRYVRKGETWMGRQRALDRFEAGWMRLTLSNADRLFDPDYADGPYYPWLKPRRLIQMGIDWDGVFVPQWTGYVRRWGQTYFDDVDAVCDVDAAGGFLILEQEKLPANITPWEIEVQADQPLVWHRLGDFSASGTMADSSGNGYHGTYSVGGASIAGLVAESSDAAVDFDGTDDYAKAATSFPLASLTYGISAGLVDTNASFEMWIKTTQVPAAGKGALICCVSKNDALPPFHLVMDEGGRLDGNYGATAVVNDGLPHHVVYDHLNGLYVDGTGYAGASTQWTLNPPPGIWLGNAPQTGNANIVPFDGTIDEFIIYPIGEQLGPTRILAHYNAGKSGSSGAWGGDTSGARVTRVLNLKGWPNVLRDIDTGSSTLQPQGEFDGSLLEYLQKMFETERGHFLMERDASLYFGARSALLTDTRSTTSQATFGDAASGETLRYMDIELVSDDTLIYPRARITREGGVPQEAANDDAEDNYGGVYERSGLQHANDNDSLDQANFIVYRYAEPQTRVEGFTISPRRDPTNLWPQARDRRVGDRVTLSRTPQGVGDPIEAAVIIEGIGHKFAPKFWRTRYAASQAETRQFWRLGVAGYSELGTTTVLAY